ncbi:NFAT activation molecule 1 [Camelus dromedarius]|uniref:NFAT activation molecule 1 n=1 Tax=Camelus dromedarius TaxID=9838 RepID=A0A5N4DEX9_CAMDR|nr:NFAT activation molecule 1 [Camelus dromedarius]
MLGDCLETRSRTSRHLLAVSHLHPIRTPFFEGGQSVTHTGLPIVVSLANKAVSFSCRITYPYIPKFKNFRVSYFHVDLQGQRSSEEQTGCTLHQGRENKTHTTVCQVTPKLPNASATGTYYCSVHWQNSSITGNGTFILVRDTGYQDPSQGPQKLLLFCFVGLLTVLSILGTALLLWKKDLQCRETEVYTCIQKESSSPSSNQGLLSQEKQRRFEDDSEFNLVYENL